MIGELFLRLDTADRSPKCGRRRAKLAASRLRGGLESAALDQPNRGRCPTTLYELSAACMPGQLLQRVCASRYLALHVLPAAMRDSVSLVYLLARVASIIAATSLISAGERFALLLALRTQLDRGLDDHGFKRIASEVAQLPTPPGEKQLLASLKPALAVLAKFDAPHRRAITACLATFIEGVELDLRTFPGDQSGSVVALRELADLERYTYLVAGNVGEFWTKLAYAHAPLALPSARDTMIRFGLRFGAALQLTKLLRECAKDLRTGRCYLPQALLERAGLNPQDLLRPDASTRARPVLNELARSALAHYRCGLNYTLALDRKSIRLRLACVWSMMIGLKTLLRLVENEAWLTPGHEATVRRHDIALVIALSLIAAPSNELVMYWAERNIIRIEARLARG